jgi:hypothetical protein
MFHGRAAAGRQCGCRQPAPAEHEDDSMAPDELRLWLFVVSCAMLAVGSLRV